MTSCPTRCSALSEMHRATRAFATSEGWCFEAAARVVEHVGREHSRASEARKLWARLNLDPTAINVAPSISVGSHELSWARGWRCHLGIAR